MRTRDLHITSSTQSKGRRLYAVINYKMPGEKAKTAWRALGLPEGSRKTDVTRAYREVVNEFEAQLREKAERESRPDADMPMYEYLCSWLERHKQTGAVQHTGKL
jgi:hypothetical protein